MAALLALNLVATMMLLMGVLTAEETRAGAVRYAAQEAAAAAASHLKPGAEASQQRRAELRAASAAERALFGVCRRVMVEMIPPAQSSLWSGEQVAAAVTCEPGATDERSARALAWVLSG